MHQRRHWNIWISTLQQRQQSSCQLPLGSKARCHSTGNKCGNWTVGVFVMGFECLSSTMYALLFITHIYLESKTWVCPVLGPVFLDSKISVFTCILYSKQALGRLGHAPLRLQLLTGWCRVFPILIFLSPKTRLDTFRLLNTFGYLLLDKSWISVDGYCTYVWILERGMFLPNFSTKVSVQHIQF